MIKLSNENDSNVMGYELTMRNHPWLVFLGRPLGFRTSVRIVNLFSPVEARKLVQEAEKTSTTRYQARPVLRLVSH